MTNAAIVADSSPLIALAIIQQLELLPNLYQQVIMPAAVWEEVTVQGKGLPGANTIEQIPWFTRQSSEPLLIEPLLILVDRGEAEAIAIAQSTPHSTVLLDDAQARRVAERLSLRRIGTLGILRRAKRAGLIAEVRGYINQLIAHGIYISPSLVEAILRDVNEL